MKNFLSILVLLLLLSSCARKKEPCNCNVRPEVEQFNDSFIVANAMPEEIFLKSVGEESLPNGASLAVRFFITEPFSGQVGIYYIHDSGGKFWMGTKICLPDSTRNYQYNVVWKKERVLSEENVQSIRKLINDSCFWTMVSKDPHTYLDATTYFLEVYDPEGNSCTERRYQMVSRGAPRRTSGFYLMCKKIAALEPDAGQFWK